MNIYLLRHGQAVDRLEYNAEKKHTDPGLGDQGVRQAELAGARLRRHDIERVYTSDLKRALRTAEIVAQHLDVELVVRPELCEIYMGQLYLKGWEGIEREYPEFYREWPRHLVDLPYPGGESGEDVRKRAMPVMEEIVAGYAGNVAVVTHGGVIKVLVSAFLGLAQEKRFQIDTDNCGISIIRYDPAEKKFGVHCVNDTAHLEVLD